MTPHQFEAAYEPLWSELERGLAALDAGKSATAARTAQLYRQCCEHLALARERAYSPHLIDRLEALTGRAHQHIYRCHDYGLLALRELLLTQIPTAVRALGWHLAVATLVFVLPTLALGALTWIDPHFILSVSSASEVREFDQMYGAQAAEHLGRTSGDDWTMFGFYILHNIGLAFQCFASGLVLGVGSLAMLAGNGLLFGALAGFLVTRGDGERFFSFVVTHSAFELTAIVLAGAAGLRLGHALLAPGRRTRAEALFIATRDTTPVMYGVMGMLLIAAAIEAFWSSAGWVAPGVKYAAGGTCWTVVLAYLALQGRGAASERSSPTRPQAR